MNCMEVSIDSHEFISSYTISFMLETLHYNDRIFLYGQMYIVWKQYGWIMFLCLTH